MAARCPVKLSAAVVPHVRTKWLPPRLPRTKNRPPAIKGILLTRFQLSLIKALLLEIIMQISNWNSLRLSGLAQTLCAAISLLVLICWFSIYADISPSVLIRDPMAVSGGKPYWGALSNIGVICWVGAASVAMFAGSILNADQGNANASRFFWQIGAFTALLSFDDLFMLHEEFFPNLLGIPEKLVMLLYLILAAYIFVRHRRFIQANWHVSLAFAVVFFAVSVGVDAFGKQLPLRYLAEDGPKFLGIVCWLFFILRVAYVTVLQRAPVKAT